MAFRRQRGSWGWGHQAEPNVEYQLRPVFKHQSFGRGCAQFTFCPNELSARSAPITGNCSRGDEWGVVEVNLGLEGNRVPLGRTDPLELASLHRSRLEPRFPLAPPGRPVNVPGSSSWECGSREAPSLPSTPQLNSCPGVSACESKISLPQRNGDRSVPLRCQAGETRDFGYRTAGSRVLDLAIPTTAARRVGRAAEPNHKPLTGC